MEELSASEAALYSLTNKSSRHCVNGANVICLSSILLRDKAVIVGSKASSPSSPGDHSPQRWSTHAGADLKSLTGCAVCAE